MYNKLKNSIFNIQLKSTPSHTPDASASNTPITRSRANSLDEINPLDMEERMRVLQSSLESTGFMSKRTFRTVSIRPSNV